MTVQPPKRKFQITKGKVIIGFIFAAVALVAAWGISNFAFKQMLSTVERIAAPNDKLRIVSQLSYKISLLDEIQRNKAFNKTGKYNNFFKESRDLKYSLDTLMALYETDSIQLARLRSIKKLISTRDRQFLNYLQVRENLVNNKSFSDEVKKLNEMVLNYLPDTNSLASESRSSTTTQVSKNNEQPKGFFNKLFGKRRPDVYKVVDEELKVRKYALNSASEDSLFKNIESTLTTIEEVQKEKSEDFLSKEANLSSASNVLTTQMINILKDVESEALAQIDLKGVEAKDVFTNGISQITNVLLLFFILIVILLFVILSDISKGNRYRKDLLAAKDEAEYLGKAKQRFLSNMSHEIRTPLQSIIGYSELISKQENPDPKSINAIYQSSNHLLFIVNEILDYNKIVSGELNLNEQVFNMPQVLAEVVMMMRPLAAQKSIEIHTKFDLDETEMVIGDAYRLKQILFNLIGNAIKFTLKGSITFMVDSKRNYEEVNYSFFIQDTGIGMDEIYLENIFNEFEQIETPEKHLINKSGTGLGLAIVKKLVEFQQGRISVKSKVGEGTTFSIFLKYLYTDKKIKNKEITQQSTIKPSGLVWIIDDDLLILNLCELIFQRNNIDYRSFNTVAEILNEKPNKDLAYVLVDMRLPGLSGLELAKILMKKLPKSVKYYAITAQVLHDERQKVLEKGFDGIIMKPFKEEDILSIFSVEESLKPAIKFDLTSLKQLTFGDENQLKKIIHRFTEECKEDCTLLKKKLADNDVQNSRLIIHRLAGRIAQIGAKELAMDFRKQEINVVQVQGITASSQEEIETLLIKLKELIKLINREIYSIP